MSAGDFLEEARANNPGGLPWEYHDGGRKAAGFRGKAGDCVTRALSIALDLDYRGLYDGLAKGNRTFWEARAKRAKNPRHAKVYEGRISATARNGSSPQVFEPVLAEAGWVKVKFPKGSRLSDLPTDALLVVSLRSHLVVVDHGVIRDTFDSSYGYNRPAFSYWRAA